MQSNAAEKIEDSETLTAIEPDLSAEETVEVDTVEDIERKSPAPVPAGIKMLLGGVALVIVLAITGLTMFSGNEPEPIANDDYIDPVSLANGKQIKESLEKSHQMEGASTLAVTDVDKKNQPSFERPVINNFSEEAVSDSTKASILDSELTKLKSILDEQGIDITQLNETLSRLKQEELGNMQTQMTAISEEIKDFKSQVIKQYADLKTVYKKRAYQANQQPTRPPFKLVSIDVWGGKTSAVILMQNKTSFAEVGEERAGWRIESIKRPNCIVTRNTVSNKRTNVCMKG